jgi:hypothetical protein
MENQLLILVFANMKKNIFATTTIFFSAMFFAPRAHAACSFPASGNVNIASSCGIDAGKVDGPDTGTGTTNSAVLTASAGTITIGTNATLAAGSITITSGTIALASGAELKPKTPIFAVDSESPPDGYAATLTFYTVTATGRVRKNTLTSVTATDCNDAAFSTTNCCLAPEYC